MESTKESVSLGKRIRKARTSKDITQIELANMLGIKPQSLANYERGIRTPSIKMLKKISQYTDTPLSVFVRDDVDIQMGASDKHIERKDAVVVLSKIADLDIFNEDIRDDLKDISYCVVSNEWGKKRAVT